MTDTLKRPMDTDDPYVDRTAVRAAPPPQLERENFKLLADFPGHWVGRGFNLIARPDHQHGRPFFLELNPTKETLDFNAIGGAIPNRGSIEDDRDLFGVHFLQQVSDARHGTGIHIEPGLWIRVPGKVATDADTYVRQSTIPHGDSLLASSTFALEVDGGPKIDPVDSFPFTGAVPGLNEVAAGLLTGEQYLDPYLTRALPKTMDHHVDAAARIRNPALLLLDDIEDQKITKTVVISVTTDLDAGGGGVLNIPFVTENANALRLDSIFWVETVDHPDAGLIMQMQYVQRVILDFDGIHWPHISVATLRKQ